MLPVVCGFLKGAPENVNTFHGFSVKHKIGAGGMSTVYMGKHITLDYPVAVKVLHPGMSGDPNFISRFEREAKAASSLNHNNIVNVIDFGSENDIYFIVMQFVDGDDLGKIIHDVVGKTEGASFPLEIALPILEEVAYGLRAAHQKGIVHRDIKPSNVMLTSEGDVKLADFGLARDVSDVGGVSGLDLTMPGTVVGTPSYMSPEQAVGGKVGATTDIFSLGVMAYQLIMGKKPFVGGTPIEVQEQIINADFPPVDETTCPRYTVEIENLLTKMLAKDPNNRFQDMDQVLRALLMAQESVDPSGGILKYKREYLGRFAGSSIAYAAELREMAINGYLKRGYHYKNMGLSNITDAAREFRTVLSLDANHAKAQAELAELKKKAEDSGVSLAAKKHPAAPAPVASDGDVTQVMPSDLILPEKPASSVSTEPSAVDQTMVLNDSSDIADDSAAVAERESSGPTKTASRPSSPNRKSKRPLVLGGVALLLVAIIAVVVIKPWAGEEETPQVVDVKPEVDNAANLEAKRLSDASLARMERSKADLTPEKLADFAELAAEFSFVLKMEDAAREGLAAGRFSESQTEFERLAEIYTKMNTRLAEAESEAEPVAPPPTEVEENQPTGPTPELVKKLNDAKNEMTTAKNRANNAKAITLAKGLYDDATAEEKKGLSSANIGNDSGHRAAAKAFESATTLFERASEVAMLNSQATNAKNEMLQAKNRLDGYPLEVKNLCADFETGVSNMTVGDREYGRQKYAEATAKYNEAREAYVAALPCLRNQDSILARETAQKEIETIFEGLFQSINDKDLDTFFGFVEMSDRSKKTFESILNNLNSIANESTQVTLRNDIKKAFVEVDLDFVYQQDRNTENTVHSNWKWNLENVDGQWQKEFIK